MTETADYRLTKILLADPLLTTAEARAFLGAADPPRPAVPRRNHHADTWNGAAAPMSPAHQQHRPGST